jgi:succinoglycan biosynthesis transport protein ExoP
MGFQSSQTSPGIGVPETSPAGFSTSITDTTLSEALITLRKRRWVVIVGFLIGLFFGIYQAVNQPKIYEAFGRIQVRSGSSNEYRLNAIQGYTGDSASRMLTEVAILQSDSLMVTVARDLNLCNSPDFLGVKGAVPKTSLDDPKVRQATVHRLQSNLHVSLVQKTDIIRISYDSNSASLATDVVNKVIAAYIQRSYQTRFDSTQRVSAWLSGQLEDLKQQVQASQEKMMDLQKKLGVLGFDPTHNQIDSSLDDLSKAANEARLNRIIAESRYRMLSGMDPNSIEGSIETTPGTAPAELNTLRAQLAGAKATYAQMEATLGPNHPQAKAQRAQIDELTHEIDTEQNRLLLQAKENFLIARANEEQTSAALENEKSAAYKLRDDLVEYTLRQREFESNRSLYESLLERLRTASVQAGLESSEIDIVDPAMLPAEPKLRPKSRILFTMVLFGIIGGIVVAFLMESLDTGIRRVTEIENIMELPSLAIIPRSKRATGESETHLSIAQRNINVLTQSKSQFAEAFRTLRTALLLSSAAHQPKLILLTSATMSEGKTTAAANLACILAQGAARVLLIDADLRRPAIHHRFGLNGKVGLTTLLAGATTLEGSVQNIAELPNLDILPSGPIPPFPTEMLSSEAMSNLLKRCSEIYTHVVIDSPPILSVTDGVILSRQVDSVVLLIRHAKSSKHVVRRTRDLLLRSGAPVTGIVLNAVDLNSPDYYGYYGYSAYSYSTVDAETWEHQPVSSSAQRNGKESRS